MSAIECPHCGGRFRADGRTAGKIIDCPKCESPFKVPGVAEAKIVPEPAADSIDSITWDENTQKLPSESFNRSRVRTTRPAQNSAGVAAVMSALWPGLGHLYLGEIGLGVALIFIEPLALALFVLPGVALWLWAIYDVYHKASGRPARKTRRR